jgi:hypothetical protein
MPGNDATRKKSAGRTKIETINPNAGVLPFNLIQTFASGSIFRALQILLVEITDSKSVMWAH